MTAYGPERGQMEMQYYPSSESPQSIELEQAVQMARRAVHSEFPVSSSVGDVRVVARQLLRALGLTP